jgi:TolB-like protein
MAASFQHNIKIVLSFLLNSILIMVLMSCVTAPPSDEWKLSKSEWEGKKATQTILRAENQTNSNEWRTGSNANIGQDDESDWGVKKNTASSDSPKQIGDRAEKKNKPEIKTVDNYIAIFDFEVRTSDKGISRSLADKVIHVFSESDKYEVIDRGNMNKILGEQKFQMSGCVAQECKVEAGQILGVGKIVNGSVGLVGKTYYLTLQLIDVKTGKVELSAEDECKCEIDELLGSTRRLAKRLLGEKVEQIVTTAPKRLVAANLPEPKSVSTSIAIVSPAAPAKETARDGRFIAYDNGTILDTKTNLMWAGKDNGSNINWANAKSYCENYRGGGYTGWRMPTQDELAGLYDRAVTGKNNCNLTNLIELSKCYSWASETRSSKGAYFIFDRGIVFYGLKSADLLRALPVRSGK